MQRSLFPAVIIAASISGAAFAGPLSLAPEERPILAAAQAPQPGFGGGGFIEFLFSGAAPRHAEPQPNRAYANAPTGDQQYEQQASRDIDPRYERQEVAYSGKEAPGTIVIDTPNKFLYLVESNGRAIRYGVGIGREGFAWSGKAKVGRKAEWPTWTPPKEMQIRQPETAQYANGMPPGLTNPLGARAMYIYQDGRDTLYRLHGTLEVWSIGQAVSSGCVRLLFHDIIDLYGRCPVGTPIVVNG